MLIKVWEPSGFITTNQLYVRFHAYIGSDRADCSSSCGYLNYRGIDGPKARIIVECTYPHIHFRTEHPAHGATCVNCVKGIVLSWSPQKKNCIINLADYGYGCGNNIFKGNS